jgi:uncharacterized protein
MYKKDLSELYKIVENACTAETNAFGYGIWKDHILYVIEYAKEFAPLFIANPEIVELAALLHDYAGIKDETLHKKHHIHGAEEAEKLLKKYNYPPEKISIIKDCILNHRGSVPGKRTTPEAKCLINADAAAHIKGFTSLLHLTYVKFNMTKDEGNKWVLKKLGRSWKKMSPNIRELLSHHYECIKKLLAQ